MNAKEKGGKVLAETKCEKESVRLAHPRIREQCSCDVQNGCSTAVGRL